MFRVFIPRVVSALALVVCPTASTQDAEGPRTVSINISGDGTPISPDLWGIFFEDINYAADGGLYAELVQNRSFEYSRVDSRNWTNMTAWEVVRLNGAQARAHVDTATPIHPNNPHYVVLDIDAAGGAGLRNGGFQGMPITAGETYNVSLFARVLSGVPGPLVVRLEADEGDILGEARIETLRGQWTQHEVSIIPHSGDAYGRLAVLAEGTGELAFDMISLFPEKTFMNRENGLRADLAQVIADLKPKFVRFPGGCLAHGDGLENMYRWKDTIGPVEQRKAQRNIWRYHQTMGLGYYEYFQFSEDIGAKPLPVVPAGVCCQNSGNYLNLVPRGQRGIPMAEMSAYVQEVLDLIEWANGPVDSEWGSRRAAAGHPEPFNLEYLGVGNEDVISEVFKERYQMISDAVKARYPEITVIGTTGPFPDGRDYEEGWAFANATGIEMVDEHGYRPPNWYWENLERFDAYDRENSLVYLGEFAAHEGNRANTLNSALAEAAYMCTIERNGDLVRLASYAPLLSKVGRTQWEPDLIYFDNFSITPSINYYVQQLFSVHQGDFYLPTEIVWPEAAVESTEAPGMQPDGMLLATWNTEAEFDDVRVAVGDNTTYAASFSGDSNGWREIEGRWRISDGVYQQRSNAQPSMVHRSFESGPEGYTLSLRARKTGGAEGFIVGFRAPDEDNFFWWNLGGWNNAQHGIEREVDGGRSIFGDRVNGRIETNRWYDIRVHVEDNRFRCYLDGQLIHDMRYREAVPTPDLSASTVRDAATGDVILKVVSKSDTPLRAAIDWSAVPGVGATATKTILTGAPQAENEFGETPQVLPQEAEVAIGPRFNLLLPPHSMTVLRSKSVRLRD